MSIAHQKDVALVAGGVTSAVASLALGADPASIAVWFQAVIDSMTARIQAGYAINRNSAMTYLRQHGAFHGAQVTPMPGSLDVAALRKRLEITGPIGFKSAIAAGQDQQLALRHMATNMAGVADENVRNGDRQVITRTAEYGHGVVGWRRRLSGRACGFCAMLASRGAVYVNRRTATTVVGRGRSVETAIRPKRAKGVHARGSQGLGEPFHPHCHCWAEPLYDYQVEPPEVRNLQAQWNRITAGESGPDAARVWRQHWEQRATPAGRARNNIPERTFRGLEEPSPSVAKAMEQADIPLPNAGKVTRLEDLPRIEDPSDIATQARATNPKVSQTYTGPKTPEIEKHGAYYSTNCTRTAIAYEMRRRGYDVTAGAATIKGDTAAAYVRTFRQEGRYAVRVAEDLNRNMSLQDIAAEVQTWPKGARGIVTMQGHTMNVERSLTTGRAVFVEAQSASRTPGMTVAALEKKLAPRRVPTDKWMAVARVDDLELSDYSLRFVESPELDIAHGQVGMTNLPESPRSAQMGFSVRATSDELAAMVPDDTYQGLARSATELRRAVTERGITVPTGLRPDGLRKLVDDLESGMPAAQARETALQTIVDERKAVASLVSQVDEALYNEASDRALASLAVQAERLPAELKQSRTLAAALRSGSGGQAGYEKRLADLQAIMDSRVTGHLPQPEQGLFGRVQLQERGGKRVIFKDNFGEDAVRNTDAEELAARVLDAIGARTPAVLRLDETSMAQEFIEGKSARTLVNDVAKQRTLAASDDGRLIGLGDILTANSDQGLNNLIIARDGRLVAVDYGAAFTEKFELRFNEADEFSRPLLGTTNDLYAPDLAIMRARIEALRPEFERLGHLDWYDDVSRRLARIEARATGTRSMLPNGREAIRREAAALSKASKLVPAKGAAAGDVVALDRSTMTVLGDAGERNGTLVFVVRPGYTTTLERKALRLERAGVQPATAEQIARARAATPAKAAKATAKKAPAKAVPSRAVGVSPGDVEIRDVAAGSGNIGVYVDGKWAGTIIVEDGRLSRLELAGGSRRSDVHFFSQDRRAIEDEVRRTIAAEQTAKDVQAGLKAMPRHAEMVSRQAIGHRETTRAGWIVEADHQTGQVVVTYRGMGLSDAPQLKAEALANYRTALEARGFRVAVEGDRLIIGKGSAPAKAVAKKATPAKKVPAPKAPPAPARMTAPALRKELEPALSQGGLLPADLALVPQPTLARWAERARTLSGQALTDESKLWAVAITEKRRALAEALSEADELLSSGASPAMLAERAAGRLNIALPKLAGWPDEPVLKALATAMQTGDAKRIRAAIKAAQRKLGLKQVGEDAGKLTRFDRATMKPIGKPIPDGAPVEVVRPGYTVEVGGREVVLSRPVVEVVQDAPEVAAAKTHVRSVFRRDVAGDRPSRVGRINDEHAEQILGAVDRQADLVPQTLMRLEGIENKTSSGLGGFASYQPITGFGGPLSRNLEGQRIWLHPAIARADADPARFAELMDRFAEAVRVGHFGPASRVLTPLDYTISHEFGHHVMRMMTVMVPSYPSGYGEFLRVATARTLLAALDKHLGTDFMAHLGQAYNIRGLGRMLKTEALDAVVKSQAKILKRLVSGYGASGSFDEMMAEIWAAYSADPAGAPAHIRAIGKVMQELAEKGAATL